MKIYYDGLQEGEWFKSLHPRLLNAELLPFPSRAGVQSEVSRALEFDRPDIILTDRDQVILVLERTEEVPSGHNVGQRFARLVAAAQMQVPLVYFGPYAARKHGGETEGPRYMNLRLFYALERLADIEKSVITAINWEVDDQYELIRGRSKDRRVIDYLNLHFRLYDEFGLKGMIPYLKRSEFEAEQQVEREEFIRTRVRDREDYDRPPPSVAIGPIRNFERLRAHEPQDLTLPEIVLYDVGMKYIRSDPYTGMSLLYAYLYCGGMRQRSRNLVLHFPNIETGTWVATSASSARKDIRLFKMAADGILFADGYLPRTLL